MRRSLHPSRLAAPVMAALASALLAGCVDLAPREGPRAAAVLAVLPSGGAYPSAARETGGPPASADVSAPWRQVFTDSRLQAVIAQALANNRDLRLAVANVAAARGQYVLQRSSLFPKLNGTASATYGQIPYGVLDGGSRSAASGVYNEREYNLSAGVSAWQLDLFGKVRDLTRAAFDSYLATRAARDAARITVVSGAADAWLTLGSDRALLAIARDTLKNGQDSLDLTTARFNSGVASDLDVAQARTFLEQARFDVARLTTQVAQDRNALELIVGAPVDDALLPPDVAADGILLTRLPPDLSSRVLLQRPDVIQAEDQLRGANANIGAARAAFFPDISLTASGGLTSLALSTLFKGASETWSFAPTVTQPIFDAGANKASLDIARAQRDASLATYEKTVQTAFREVSDALAQRGTIDEQLAAQQALTQAAAQGYRLSSARYERGADTYLNALIAQRTLYSARQTLVTTRLAQATNLVTLYTALGGGVN